MSLPAMRAQFLLLLQHAISAAALFLSVRSHPASANGSLTQTENLAASFLLIETVKNDSLRPTNLIENGSFEDGNFDLAPGGDNHDIFNWFSNPDAISAWVLANGSIDRARGRWKRASDCTPTSIDLTGTDPGTIMTSFQAASANTPHSILLDATANPDALSPINGTFSVAVLTRQNVTLNSSLIYVDGRGYNQETIGWRTYAVFFTSPPILNGNLTLSLSSNIIGWYGPLIDNIRIYEGIHFPNTGIFAFPRVVG